MDIQTSDYVIVGDSDNTNHEVFYAYIFGKYPSEGYINYVNKNFLTALQEKIKLELYSGYYNLENYIEDNHTLKGANGYYINYNHKLLLFEHRVNEDWITYKILFNQENIKLVEELFLFAKDFIVKEEENIQDRYLSLLLKDSIQGFFSVEKKITFNILSDEVLQIHYGKNFLKVYTKLVEFFKQNQGLLLLYGKPGTGKTTILKQLISVCQSDVLYLTPECLDFLGSPEFVTFLLKNTPDVLLAEDAESILLQKKEREKTTANLLNLTEGLLSNVLETKFICTFNTDLNNIDTALLRPGRLFFKYEFNPLTVEESNIFLEYYNSSKRVETEKTLAELFQYLEE